MKFVPFSQFKKGNEEEEKRLEKLLIVSPAENNENENENEKNETESKDDKDMPVPAKEYDYLLAMPLWSLTYERVEELLSKKKDKELEITTLEKMTTKEMWRKDLEEFIQTLDDVERDEEKREDRKSVV